MRSYLFGFLALSLFLTVSVGAWEPEGAFEPEALTWLKEECPPDFFAAKPRFSVRRVERLVRRLYAAGALEVKAARMLGEFAGLRVFLPLHPERRRDIISLVNKRRAECSLVSVGDTGQEEIVLWFC